jgi:hypothetical protein
LRTEGHQVAIHRGVVGVLGWEPRYGVTYIPNGASAIVEWSDSCWIEAGLANKVAKFVDGPRPQEWADKNPVDQRIEIDVDELGPRIVAIEKNQPRLGLGCEEVSVRGRE